MAFLASLDRRLDHAETCFVQGDYQLALQESRDVVRDLLTLMSLDSGSRTLDDGQHQCVEGCVCQAAICLGLQSLYYLQRFDEVDEFLLHHYSSFTKIPYDVFVLWAQLKISLRAYETVCQKIVQYLEHDKLKVKLLAVSSSLPSLSPTPSAPLPTPCLSTEQYHALIELLVFHGLVPLAQYQQAIEFVRKNPRILEHIKQGYLHHLEKLQACGYTDEVGDLARKTAPETDVDLSALHHPSAASPSVGADPPESKQPDPPIPQVDRTWRWWWQQLISPSGLSNVLLTKTQARVLRTIRLVGAFVALVAVLRVVRIIVRFFGLYGIVQPIGVALKQEVVKFVSLALNSGFGRLLAS